MKGNQIVLSQHTDGGLHSGGDLRGLGLPAATKSGNLWRANPGRHGRRSSKDVPG